MLRIAILDANDKASTVISGVTSIVGHWLGWELAQAEIVPAEPGAADVIFMVIASSTDWPRLSRSYLKRHKIQPDVVKRAGRPYVIAGGAADAIPLTVLQIADAVAIGEAYTLVRNIIGLIKHGATIDVLRQWVEAYPHAIERAQVESLQRDAARPWLLDKPIDPLASPDEWVDWEGMPLVRGDDKVVRIVAEKGCWLKCKFCASTYRQTNRQNPNADDVLSKISALARRGERAQLVTNDVSNLTYFERIPDHGTLAQQSLTLAGLKNEGTFNAILRAKPRIIRIGVEGLSPRIRQAFGKPMSRDELLAMLVRLHDNRQMTHLFYIVGAPYEQIDDWDEYRRFYAELALQIRWGICRIKYTSFVPDPPTPLARFLPATHYVDRMQELKRWVMNNAATRHSMSVWARQLTTRLEDYATAFGVSKDTIYRLLSYDETIDLAPTLEDAYRLPWEIVRWPLSVEKRWRLGESYKKIMGVQKKAYELHREC